MWYCSFVCFFFFVSVVVVEENMRIWGGYATKNVGFCAMILFTHLAERTNAFENRFLSGSGRWWWMIRCRWLLVVRWWHWIITALIIAVAIAVAWATIKIWIIVRSKCVWNWFRFCWCCRCWCCYLIEYGVGEGGGDLLTSNHVQNCHECDAADDSDYTIATLQLRHRCPRSQHFWIDSRWVV